MSDQARPQLDKFKELAREVEADENETAFDEKLRRIVKNPPQKSTNSSDSAE